MRILWLVPILKENEKNIRLEINGTQLFGKINIYFPIKNAVIDSETWIIFKLENWVYSALESKVMSN